MGRCGELSYFERLAGILLAPQLDLGSKLERLFAGETTEFGLDYAFFSSIDPDARTERFDVVHGRHESLKEGNTVPLSESYCRETVADPDGTMVVDDALAEGWDEDPAYEKLGFGSYVGTTVTSEDELYGTLCFASAAPRGTPIADEEVTLVEILGRWATYELNRWADPPTHGTAGAFVDGDVSPSRIDSMMDALGKPARRIVLLHLLDESAESSLDILARRMDDADVETQLHHTHLPKLDRDGYIDWNPDSNVVSRGPNYPDIEPLLRLLSQYATEPPE